MDFFNRITLQTPESVELEFTLAGIGNRAYALLIDGLILGGVSIVILIVFAVSWVSLDLSKDDSFGLWLYAIQALIVFAISIGYFAFFETLWQGQTPGKRRVKIRVIRDDGRPIGLQQATLRSLILPIDQILFMGAFFIMLGKKEKRIGDWVAGTLVVQEERPTLVKNLQLSQEAQGLAERLKQEAAIAQLLPEDFAVIRDYLQRREGMILSARHEVARKLAYQIKDMIQLANIPDGVTASLFLEAVYLAYQQQSSSMDY
ncbi:MAG: RDD family protein [Microcystaceae cyanobacterium]